MNKRALIILIIGIALAVSALGIILAVNNLSNKEADAGVEIEVSNAPFNTENLHLEEAAIEASEEEIETIIENEVVLIEAVQTEEIKAPEQEIIIAQPIQVVPVMPPPPFKYTIIPESPRPGEPVTIAFENPVRYADLMVNGNRVARARGFTVPADDEDPSFNAAVFAVPSTVNPGNAIVRLTGTSGTLWEILITIAHREFRSETLNLTPTMSSIVTTPDPQRTIESERLWQILATTGNEVYHTDPFIVPVTSTRRTSQYGARRINVYPDGRRTTEIHAGVDIGAPVAGQPFLGANVYACGRGMVILSRSRIVSGNSIIIEHAPGIYSIYYHLDSVIAEEGEIVETGDLIGHVGSTGFSTGAHLHWELRVSTENTDPDAFVARPLIDKNLIISRLFD